MGKPRTADELFFWRVREIAERLRKQGCPFGNELGGHSCRGDCSLLTAEFGCVPFELARMTGVIDDDGDEIDWD